MAQFLSLFDKEKAQKLGDECSLKRLSGSRRYLIDQSGVRSGARRPVAKRARRQSTCPRRPLATGYRSTRRGLDLLDSYKKDFPPGRHGQGTVQEPAGTGRLLQMSTVTAWVPNLRASGSTGHLICKDVSATCYRHHRPDPSVQGVRQELT